MLLIQHFSPTIFHSFYVRGNCRYDNVAIKQFYKHVVFVTFVPKMTMKMTQTKTIFLSMIMKVSDKCLSIIVVKVTDQNIATWINN